MAKMVPDAVLPDAPASERRIFHLLRESPGTLAWTVFHSVGLSSAYAGAYGEIDFVVLIPDRGVVCVEVKGGRVSCESGVWKTKDRDGKINDLKSPFVQARDGMFKLSKAIRTRFPGSSAEANCPIGWLVIFTDSSAPPPSPDFTRDELIDSRDLVGDPVKKIYNCPSLKRAIDNRGAPKYPALSSIGKFLRPEFSKVSTQSTNLWDAEQRIIRLTEEQYDTLESVVENKSSLIIGGAGSGKTMLALELARRLSSEGRSVLLTCYNRELGNWLKAQAAGFGPGKLVAGNLHPLMGACIERSQFRSQFSTSDPFDDSYYELAALAILDCQERFDTVIVDEAQDFPASALLDVVDSWVSSPMKSPSSVFFADFSRQAIYTQSVEERELLRRREGVASFKLTRNCRNTREIIREIEVLTGAVETHGSDRQPTGAAPERLYYDCEGDQIKAIDRVLRSLREEGFKPEEIVILGNRKLVNSKLSNVKTCGGFQIVDRQSRTGNGEIVYSTIQGFKGMESPAVVLLAPDIDASGRSDSLLYVGLTRARYRLALILAGATRVEISRREALRQKSLN